MRTGLSVKTPFQQELMRKPRAREIDKASSSARVRRHSPVWGPGKLRENRDDLVLALYGDRSLRHRYVLQQLDAHIRFLEQRLAEIAQATQPRFGATPGS